MVVGFVDNAIDQFNMPVFPIWNWSTTPAAANFVVGLALSGKRAKDTMTGKRGSDTMTGKRAKITFSKLG